MFVALALTAMGIELCFGYPSALLRAIGHPVIWIGSLIGLLDRRLNRKDSGRGHGIIAVLIVLVMAGSAAALAQHVLFRLSFGPFLAGLAASSLIAQRSL